MPHSRIVTDDIFYYQIEGFLFFRQCSDLFVAFTMYALLKCIKHIFVKEAYSITGREQITLSTKWGVRIQHHRPHVIRLHRGNGLQFLTHGRVAFTVVSKAKTVKTFIYLTRFASFGSTVVHYEPADPSRAR